MDERIQADQDAAIAEINQRSSDAAATLGTEATLRSTIKADETGAVAPPALESGTVSDQELTSAGTPDKPVSATSELAKAWGLPPSLESGVVADPNKTARTSSLPTSESSATASSSADEPTAEIFTGSDDSAPTNSGKLYDWDLDTSYKHSHAASVDTTADIEAVSKTNPTPTPEDNSQPLKATSDGKAVAETAEAEKTTHEPAEISIEITDKDNPIRDVNRQIRQLEKEIATGVTTAPTKFGPEELEERKARLVALQEYKDHLRGQDYAGKDGQLRDGSTGKVKVGDKDAESTLYRPDDEKVDYSKLGLLDQDGLIDRLAEAKAKKAEAERLNDRTTSMDMDDLIEQISDNIADKQAELMRGLSSDKSLSGSDKVEVMGILRSEIERRINETDTGVSSTAPTETSTSSTTPPENDAQTKEGTANEATTPDTATAPDDSSERQASEEYDPDKEFNLRAELQESIDNYAKAKIRTEGTLRGNSKSRQEELKDAETKLKESFDNLMKLIPQGVTDVELYQGEYKTYLEQRRNTITETLERLRTAGGSDQAEIEKFEALLVLVSSEYDTVTAHLEKGRHPDRNAHIALEVIGIQKSVDQAVIDQRANKMGGRFSKLANFLVKRPGTRILLGGVLLGASFTPLAPAARVLQGALRGVGAYEGIKAIGELKAAHKMKSLLKKGEIENIDNYLDASRQQSQTRRRTKRIGALVGTIAGLTPFVSAILDHHVGLTTHSAAGPKSHVNVAGSHASTPSTPTTPVSATSTPTNLNIQPSTYGGAPWTNAMQNYNTNISNQGILNQLVNNRFGIKFLGNGQGNGNGQILSVFIPGQGTFTDNFHINGAINFLLSNGGVVQ